MTSAVRLALDYGFRCLRLRRVVAYVYLANAASIAVLLRSGFVRESVVGDKAKFAPSPPLEDLTTS